MSEQPHAAAKPVERSELQLFREAQRRRIEKGMEIVRLLEAAGVRNAFDLVHEYRELYNAEGCAHDCLTLDESMQLHREWKARADAALAQSSGEPFVGGIGA